ncbi:c-type cytochrome [Malikia sp.]|uniref:c-type cytochrome n=1 Tax=Malikia sp. TaxID=2070706 RepID=UPI0026279200|nr:c-type cytochrome [Malikia sp.]MDD2728982.1 c-type cytochrome [Malikia sp.]
MSDFANALQTGHPNARHGWTLPMIGAVGLALLLGGCGKTASNSIEEDAAMAQRLQRVGTVELQVATAGGAPKTGEQAFQAQCAACHATGALGSPKFGDAAAWAPRIATGQAALTNSALKGKNAMPPQAGGALSDLEVSRAVAYMANAGGAKFAEPKGE